MIKDLILILERARYCVHWKLSVQVLGSLSVQQRPRFWPFVSPPLCVPPQPVRLKPDEEAVAVVGEFKYLGNAISQDCTLDREVSIKIKKASNTFGCLYNVLWCRRRVKKDAKMCLFKSAVIPTLSYGSETWVPAAIYTCEKVCYPVPLSDIEGDEMGQEEEHIEIFGQLLTWRE